MTSWKRLRVFGTYQQSAVVVQLRQQDAPVVEEVGGADAAIQVTEAGLHSGVQLRVDVKLPGIGWFLHLQGHKWLY